MSEFNACLRNGQVSLGADLSTVAEVTHLFGLKATKLPYHSWFNVPGKKDVIGWLPSEEGGKGWHNVPEYGPNMFILSANSKPLRRKNMESIPSSMLYRETENCIVMEAQPKVTPRMNIVSIAIFVRNI